MHVATDVAARGLGISNVDLIIHYELPNGSDAFVHCFGGIGSVGKEGTVVLHSEMQRRVDRGTCILFVDAVMITPERNGMVGHFGKQVSGSAFTVSGWVQPYGSRYVKATCFSRFCFADIDDTMGSDLRYNYEKPSELEAACFEVKKLVAVNSGLDKLAMVKEHSDPAEVDSYDRGDAD
uniref:Uncharacterized protein n=1 Tax=Vitis vinifera TaxID=29760 RepID=A5C7A1_VITVI|nr:hypothetical protein VITISV_042291 [Vitis vinifera]